MLSIVQHVFNTWTSGTTVAVTITANAAGNLLIVSQANSPGNLTLTGVTDNASGGSNSYSSFPGSTVQPDATRVAEVWYCLQAAHAGATTITATFNGTPTANTTVFVQEVSGFITPAIDGNGVTSSSVGAVTLAGGTITITNLPARSDFLLGICYGEFVINQNPTTGNEFTGLDVSVPGAQSQAVCALITSGTGPHNASWTQTGSNNLLTSTVAFKETTPVIPVSQVKVQQPFLLSPQQRTM